MPQIIKEQNPKFIETLNIQAKSCYYRNWAEMINNRMKYLITRDFFEYNRGEALDKDIERVKYEFENDMFGNELKILVIGVLSIKKRLLTDNELFLIYMIYLETKSTIFHNIKED